jgi:hypothetical protein
MARRAQTHRPLSPPLEGGLGGADPEGTKYIVCAIADIDVALELFN